jgi:cation transport ATPase
VGTADIITADVAKNAAKTRTPRHYLHEARQFIGQRLSANLCSGVAIVAAFVAGHIGTGLIILLFAVVGNVVQTVQTNRTPAPCTYAFPEIAGWFADFLMYALLALALVSVVVSRSLEDAIPLLAIAGALNICAISQFPIIAALCRLNRLGFVPPDTGHLERLATVDTVALDETQLIGVENGQVVKLQPAPGIGFNSLLAAVSSVKDMWSASITAAIGKAAKQRRVAPLKSRAELAAASNSYCLFEPNGTLLGTMLVSKPRPDEYEKSVEFLRQMKLEILLLTADYQTVARQRAAALGIEKCEGELFPEDAQYKLSTMLGEGRRIVVVNGVADASAPLRPSTQPGEFLTMDTSLPRAVDAIRIARTTCKLIELILAMYLLVATVSVGMAMADVLSPALAAVTAYGADWALLFGFGWFAWRAVPAPKLSPYPLVFD